MKITKIIKIKQEDEMGKENKSELKTEETNVLSAFINRMSVILEYIY